MLRSITVERSGHTWIAHPTDHDCLSDEGQTEHGEADHPTAAIRKLLAANPQLV